MLKVEYKLYYQELEEKYLEALFSTKFSNEKNAKDVQEKFNELIVEYPYSVIFYDVSFKYLVFLKPEEIKNLICKIEKRTIEQSKVVLKLTEKNNKVVKREFRYEFKEKIQKVFKYGKKFQLPISKFFEKNIELGTCYFCNINFINDYRDNDGKFKNEFTLDHYFDKGDYPYLALSLYNLVPSCYTCNSKLKRTQKITSLAPTSKNFDFNEKVKFKLFLAKKNKDLQIEESDDIEIPLKENYSDEYEKYKTVFKLDERYETHKKEVFELIEKARLYPDSKLEEMAKITGQNIEEIRNSIFNIPKDDEDLHKRPLSKLIKDISEELKLI